MATLHHRCVDIRCANGALGDQSTVIVGIDRFAAHVAPGYQARQAIRSFGAAGPCPTSPLASLIELWRVDAKKPDLARANCERITILGKGDAIKGAA